MKKASEYRQYAAECRKLASTMEDEQRDQLLTMAETWEQMADDRERLAAVDELNFRTKDNVPTLGSRSKDGSH